MKHLSMKHPNVVFCALGLIALLFSGGFWVNRVINAPDLRMGRYRRVSNIAAGGNTVSHSQNFVLNIKPGGTWVRSEYGSGRHVDQGPYTLEGNNIRVMVLTDHTYEYKGRFEENTLLLESGSFKTEDSPDTEQRYIRISSQ